MRLIGSFFLHELVATIVELGNVSTQILNEGELSSRVLSFIAIEI